MRRPLAAAALLLLAYVALSLLNDPRGSLGTDTGGKVATLRSMQVNARQGHVLDPDVGYWAAHWDPTGRLHPLWYTYKLGGKWVNVTTLPMLDAAYPLWRLGGYRAALLLPMLGSVLAAFAARALVQRLGGDERAGWGAFWLVGLASPLTIYALDLWEHSLGVALMAWGVVLLVDCWRSDRRWPRAAAAGALFGLAATMRTEALVYAAVAAGVVGLLLLLRSQPRRLAALAALGGAFLLAALVPLLANAALERATVGTTIRAGRTTAAARGAPAVGIGTRADEAGITSLALSASTGASAWLIGGASCALLLFALGRATQGRERQRVAAIALAGVVVVYVVRFGSGLGFVPGLAAATPLAVVGVALGWTSDVRRVVLAVALVALPLIFALQYSGGASAQWAGRYLLPSGWLLGVVGIASLGRLPAWARGAVIALAVAVTVFGLAWTAQRTHQIARGVRTLDRRPEPVLVSRIAHLVREGGAFWGDKRWLTAASDGDERLAADVVHRAGITSFAVVAPDSPRPPADYAGFARTHVDRLALFSGYTMRVVTYTASP